MDTVSGSSPSSAVVCSLCGATAESPPLDWTLEIEPRRGRQWTCVTCARTHLRAIEAKLEQEWW